MFTRIPTLVFLLAFCLSGFPLIGQQLSSNKQTATTHLSRSMPKRYNNLKLNVSSISNGGMSLTYERFISHRFSFEVEFGLSGLGKNEGPVRQIPGHEITIRGNASGFLWALGIKYRTSVKGILNKSWQRHLLAGWYIRPGIMMGTYNYEFNYLERPVIYSTQNTMPFTTLQASLGKQWLLFERVSIDVFWGFGIGMDSFLAPILLYYKPTPFAFAVNSDIKGHSIFNSGIKLGWLF